MLLEWGHTFWYDNIGNLKSNMPDWVHKGFLKGDYDQDKVLEVLEQQREEYCGNYDGFLGYVRNFEWSLRKDGGYDITLDLISIGDVIESLKVNTNYPTSKTTDAKKSDSEKTEIIIRQLTDKRGFYLDYGLRGSEISVEKYKTINFITNETVELQNKDEVKAFLIDQLKQLIVKHNFNVKEEHEDENGNTMWADCNEDFLSTIVIE
jgi:hypothetical protein